MIAMGEEAQERQPEINEISEEERSEIKKKHFLRQYKWWVQMIFYSLFLLAGQAVGTLLGRIYYDNGGKSNWLATLVQVAGFPVLIPFQLFTKLDDDSTTNNKRLPLIIAAFYIAIGIFLAVDCMLYSIGLQYLPVTTYTLLCATQLGFNAVFSFFLNRQKFTPYIINSLVLLTISSTLLVFVPDSDDASNKISKRKYVVGFICTVAASAGYAIMLSLTQLAFQRLIKKETIRAVVDMTVYQNLVATGVIVVGLFASGDWKKLQGEMEGFTSGKASYVMNLFWTAVSWQVFGIGCVGLIFKVSSLFSNVISILGLPVAPVLAVIFLGDRLTGLKAVSMLLAMWGFVSYIYQHYLDDLKIKEREKSTADHHHDLQASNSLVALVNERGGGEGSAADHVS